MSGGRWVAAIYRDDGKLVKAMRCPRLSHARRWARRWTEPNQRFVIRHYDRRKWTNEPMRAWLHALDESMASARWSVTWMQLSRLAMSLAKETP